MTWTKKQWAQSTNMAFYIAGMSGTPSLTIGGPGSAKSQSVISFAKSLGYDPLLLICSNRAAEDFSGIPRLDLTHYETVPADFLMRATKPKCCLIFDELLSIPPHVRAAVMSIWSERIFATKHRLADDCLIFGMANPPEQTPNGSPLEPPIANRFFHHKWKHNYADWKTGMMTADLEFPAPSFPDMPTPGQTVSQRIKYGALITTYCDQNPQDRERFSDDPEELSYPTPRSWTNLRNALAIADAMGATEDVTRDLCVGFVGRSAGQALNALIANADLLPADDYLDGKFTYHYQKNKPEEAVVLMANLTTALRLNYSPQRLARALEVYCNQIGTHNREIVCAQLKALTDTRPKGELLTPECLKPLTDFGSRLTPKMKAAAAR
jgi:MoxR-like ATPase